jgi:class 3 adenylate cyclase
MPAQPIGMVTLLFTDIEGSTRLLERLGTDRYAGVLELHRQLLREAFARHDGYEVGTEGDALFVAFASAPDAVAAAEEGQQALAGASWPDNAAIKVRMGIHTGEPLASEANYVGMDVHRTARIMSAGHGGQVVVSAATRALVDGELTELGEHRLKDFDESHRDEQVEHLGAGEVVGTGGQDLLQADRALTQIPFEFRPQRANAVRPPERDHPTLGRAAQG